MCMCSEVRGTGSSGAGITGCSETPDMDAGNLTRVFW
ncbi:rCG56867, isoform CRA_b [Rattus norvegicus]|uniref:RCG56867, isoform CRA_b n=1 Tax=Rattus norvegicus TaxID=10116 RepID=A6KNU0_RAT|nr:rCG56867, isoform CRA_b [Rattus norvegicus]EDL87984.1 rCG56867, isoform CRA_b [Rattus norvegicus]